MRGTGVFESIEVGLVFRSVGYRGIPIPDVPFDERKGLIPRGGPGASPPGGEAGTTEYVVGGSSAAVRSLGANKRDSAETVRGMMEDIRPGGQAPSGGKPWVPGRLLTERNPARLFPDWQLIDAEEQERGRKRAR